MTLQKLSHIIVLAFVVFIPYTTHAYTAYDKTVQRLTNNTAVYTISFSLGQYNHDVYVPINAERTIVNDLMHQAVGFTFTTSEEGDTSAGTAAGIVLSNAATENGAYKVPAGTAAEFTIVVILKLNEVDPRAKYGLQITNLPYIKQNQEETKYLGLNKYELAAYTTKEIGLNK